MSTSPDYIRDYMAERTVDPARCALVIIDMQYATGSRQGALGLKLAAQGSNVGDYRFERIERLVLPHTLAHVSSSCAFSALLHVSLCARVC